jgi:cytochrome P450
MVTHPEVQRIAQEEIDRVVGNNRLPDFNDRRSLPYIEALYHEVMRYSPPLPLGVPHGITEDDVYEGYFLPKGNYPYYDLQKAAKEDYLQGLRL